MPTPSIERQVESSEMSRRTFLPYFSMRIVEKKVPMTWVRPHNIALRQASSPAPEL